MKSKRLPIQEPPGTEGLRDSGSIIINLAPSSPELRAKLHLLETTSPGVTFRFSREPLQDPEITLYLIPLSSLRWLSGPGAAHLQTCLCLWTGPRNLPQLPAGLYRLLERALGRTGAPCPSGAVQRDCGPRLQLGSILFCHGECTGPEGQVLLGPKEAVIFRTLVRFRGRCVSRSVLATLSAAIRVLIPGLWTCRYAPFGARRERFFPCG